jgi:O-antigen ligase
MPAVALVAALVGLVWGALLLWRGGLLAGCLMVMLAGVCFSVPFFKLELGPIPLTADRALLVVVAVQYLVWRRWGLADPKPFGAPEVVLGLLVALTALSTFRADFAAANYQPVASLILYYLMPLAVYWVARDTRLSERSIVALWGALGALGVYLAAVTIAERYELWAFVFPRYIAATAREGGAEFVGRGRGPLLNPIGNGILLSVCLAGALMLWPRLGRAGRLGLALAAAAMLAAIYCTMTRSAWMGGLFVTVLIVGAALPRTWRMPLAAGAALLVALTLAAQWDHVVRFKRDRELSAAETADSVRLRPILARIAWNMFLDRPILGCGYQQYAAEALKYTADRDTSLPLEKGRGYVPHNVFLSVLAESGVVAAGLLVALLALWGLDGWRLWSGDGVPRWARGQGLLMLAALGVYVINGMFHDVSCVAMANMTLFFVAGATAALRPLAQAAATATWPRSRAALATLAQP